MIAWDRLPDKPVAVALRLWSFVPRPLQVALAPLGRLVNPRSATTAQPLAGPEVVPGVSELILAGFTPLEQHTGFMRLGEAWPEPHRRSVPETRSWWLDDMSNTETNGTVWLVRSPWPPMSVTDTLNVLWAILERDRSQLRDEEARLAEARRVLHLTEAEARALLPRDER